MPRKYTIGLGEIIGNLTQGEGFTVITTANGTFKNQVLGDVGSTVLVPTTIDPATVIDSQESVDTYHSTLFADFDLEAESTYNFYVGDETDPSKFPDEKVPLADVPRYVTISWNHAPNGQWLYPQVTGKRQRPIGVKPPKNPVALSNAKTSTANGYLNPGSLRATIVPPITRVPVTPVNDDEFLMDPRTVGSPAISPRIIAKGSLLSTRASFVDPSIAGGALSSTRLSVLKQPEHIASLTSLATIAGSLEVISQFNQDVPKRHPIPVFPVQDEPTPARYIGYVIERYDMNPDGSMQLGRTIDLDDIAQGYFVDRQVVYGMEYSYRIRAILQWIRPANIGFNGPSTTDLAPSIGSINPTKSVVSFYAGDWSDWAKTEVIDSDPPAWPDEFTVLPRSNHGLIRISWKLPSDHHRDIASIELFRRTDGTRWVSLGKFAPTNGALDDSGVTVGTSYIYTAVCWSVHGLVSPFCEQMQVSLTRNPKRGEVPAQQISQAGVKFGNYNTLPARRPPSDIRAKRNVTFYCRTAESDRSLALRQYEVSIRSLSTGERVTLPLSADAVAKVGSPAAGKISVQRRKGS